MQLWGQNEEQDKTHVFRLLESSSTFETMPPRLHLFTRFRPPTKPTTVSSRPASTVAQKRRKHQDPYALAQSRARRAANISKQEVLRVEREKALGDPVRGLDTRFVQSFDSALPLAQQTPTASPVAPATGRQAKGAQAPSSFVTKKPSQQKEKGPDHLNHFIAPNTLSNALKYSKDLTAPVPPENAYQTDPQREDRRKQTHKTEHEIARSALERIVSIDNSSSQDKTRVNIQRCIDTFGRHNTDQTLPPPLKIKTNDVIREETPGIEKGSGSVSEMPAQEEPLPRAGPDTGSSEVQVAILTAKIRTLANHLESTGRKDMMNKRNLRLLVHRRQKLLKYLRRKERGGPRWENLVQTLGLTEGTWKGEITM